jgi:tRNA-dihydrouridine synthase B
LCPKFRQQEICALMKAIKIGGVEIADPVILAPMSGVTDLPFRKLVKQEGAGLVVSEMIASQAMINANRKTLKMASNCAEEFPMAVQLAGCDPKIMAEAAKLNEDRGAAIIDINMGCPAKKVVNGYAGSALMREEDKAARIMEATVKAVSLPVTLKMRTGWDDNNRNAPRLAKIAQEAGIQMITVHGRTRCQFYNGHSDWDFIARVKEAVRLPVIANGDIQTFKDVEDVLLKSKADGVMIGRGAYGRPWFLKQVMDFLKTGKTKSVPPLQRQYSLIRSHYEEMLFHYGELAGMRMARKHLGWYTKGLPRSAEFRAKVNSISDPKGVVALIESYFFGLFEQGMAA